METDSQNRPSLGSEFMLKEYDRIIQHWLDETRQAEQRVSFFLTLATATTGAIILVSQTSLLPNGLFYVVAQGTLIILLLFGITFLNRLAWRGCQTRAFRQSLIDIQNYFAILDPEVARYLEMQRRIYSGRQHKSTISAIVLGRFGGTLIDTMILGNALIIAGIAAIWLLANGYTTENTVMWVVVTVILSMTILYVYGYLVRRISWPWQYY
jgi:hypothetical protein